MRVLCAYATRHGSTQGIAERIAATLANRELEVTLRPVSTAGDPAGYDAVVIGSAAYLGGWLDDATRYVRRHARCLAERPVWLFSSGPVGPDLVDAKGRDVVMASRPKEFVEFEATLHPRDMRVFFGAFDAGAAPIGMAERLMTRMLRFLPEARNAMPDGDYRDWPAIEAWATSVAESLMETRPLLRASA